MHPWLWSPSPPSSCLELRFGNPLTPQSSPTIVFQESRMSGSFHLHEKLSSTRPRRGACFLLALFLLYNPFFAMLHSPAGLDFSRPASHRATVGASELQHFTPANGWGYLLGGDFAETVILAPRPQLSAESFFAFPFFSLISPSFFVPSLWFRPPPAL